jgi:hypothetical protein
MKKLALLALTAVLCGLMLFACAEGKPTTVDSPQALAAIANDPYGNYVLTKDINMAGVDWAPIEFYGTLDGAGHSLYNLKITKVGQGKARTADGNLKKYDTYFAALFAVVKGAAIKDLNLMNVSVSVTTDKINCFAAGLAGLAEDTNITGCGVQGRVYLYQNRYMCGVAGLVGSGYGTISGCSADVELVIVDGNRAIKCEEFLGGILGAGYFDIDHCTVKLTGYASVHGYVHNGGVMGMYKIYTAKDRKHAGHVQNCSADARITFFEHNNDRRAYCKAIIGEKLNKSLDVSNNTVISFESHETRDYNTVLLPEMCQSPVYTAAIIPPAVSDYGYTKYTCKGCGYTYTDDYVHPEGAEQ